MMKWIETTGKNEEEAIQKALRELGLDRDEVSVEILERAKSGFLGIGSTPAKIKVTYEAADEAPAPRACGAARQEGGRAEKGACGGPARPRRPESGGSRGRACGRSPRRG